MIQPQKLTGLKPSTRLEAGRAWNAYARWKKAEYDTKVARAEFGVSVIKLRAGHRLSAGRVAELLGLPIEVVRRVSYALKDPSHRGRKRVVVGEPRPKAGRPPARLSGAAPDPAEVLAALRSERSDREPSEG